MKQWYRTCLCACVNAPFVVNYRYITYDIHTVRNQATVPFCNISLRNKTKTTLSHDVINTKTVIARNKNDFEWSMTYAFGDRTNILHGLFELNSARSLDCNKPVRSVSFPPSLPCLQSLQCSHKTFYQNHFNTTKTI